MEYPTFNNNQGEQVSFNEAANVISRLNDIQVKLNSSFANLIAFDNERQEHNFNLAHKDLNIMLCELSQDLTDPELDEAKKHKEAINFILKKYPIRKTIKIEGNIKIKFDMKVFEVLEKALHEYRYALNKMKKKHGYGNPPTESSSTAMLR